MTISKMRKDKRKKSHYHTKCVTFVLEGGHPDWLPKNDRGNLFELTALYNDLKEGFLYCTRPPVERVDRRWRIDREAK